MSLYWIQIPLASFYSKRSPNINVMCFISNTDTFCSTLKGLSVFTQCVCMSDTEIFFTLNDLPYKYQIQTPLHTMRSTSINTVCFFNVRYWHLCSTLRYLSTSLTHCTYMSESDIFPFYYQYLHNVLFLSLIQAPFDVSKFFSF